MELVVCFLYVAQADCRQYSGEDILAERYCFSIGLASRGAVSLKIVGRSKRPVSVSARGQVFGRQILQGAARLGKHGFYLVPSESQGSPGGDDLSDKMWGLVVRLGALQGGFSRLEFLFHAGCLAINQQQRGIPPPQRGPGIQDCRRQRRQPVQYGSHRATKVQGNPLSLYQPLGALDIIGGGGMVKRFNIQAIVFIPLAG